ncbi:MAG: hypothetical protein AB7U83_10315 [Vicinamibacterales bacterium]
MQIRHAVIALGIVALSAGAAQAQPVLNAPTVAGANITFSWSAGPGGTTSYNVDAALTPGGPYIASFNVGNVTGVSVTAPAVGVYYVRIVALPGGEASNEVQVVVNSLVAPPAPPTSLQAYRNGTGVVIGWAPGVGGGPVASYQLRAGLTPGGSELGVIPTAAAGVSTGGVPPNTYYLGVRAVNAGGVSGESSEVALVMPPGGACDPPPAPSLTTTAWGQFLTAAWSPIPGAVGYLLSASGPINAQVPFGGGQTSFLYPTLPVGSWQFGIQAQFSCGALGAVGGSALVVDGSSLKLTPRAPDPAGPTPPNFIPLPNRASVVNAIAAQYPNDLRNSCVEHGGNNRFLFRVVQELRKEDKRWGLNWKRNNVGDMSQDVINYNYGSDPDEGTRQVHVVDIIGGHCGNNPSANWQDQTVLFSTGATWTLIPYIQAGYIP